MVSDLASGFGLDRRRWLKLGITSTVAAWLPGMLLHAQSADPKGLAPSK